MNLRTWVKKTPAGRLFWRVFIGVLGGGITVLGGIALIGPGPGVLVVLAGLGILATEFAWAGRAMEKTKSIAKSAAEKTGLPLWVKYFVVAGGAVISIVAVFIYHWH
ncbi:unannotated protein [freshwater metagenome]|jgi:hypothetical protein|uniref:Unannotated protein n=1 Tax=freshwater metagenome TaxID=449393 RepID=A0A6J7T5Y3_9ZZZZ|nr:TIGR02611 family protein [Actinomycetota bacterium]MTB03582.1 TIGR02611 family protein [Actinomycetota bacterium]